MNKQRAVNIIKKDTDMYSGFTVHVDITQYESRIDAMSDLFRMLGETAASQFPKTAKKRYTVIVLENNHIISAYIED